MRPEDEFLASVEGLSRRGGGGPGGPTDFGTDRLVTAYQKAYERRYGIAPLIEEGGRFILNSLLRACLGDGRGVDFALKFVETYLTVDTDWFVKNHHSLQAMKNNFNAITAAMGAKNKTAVSTKNLIAVDPIDIVLYYLYESVYWQRSRKLTRTGDNIITAEGHILSRSYLHQYLGAHWNPKGTDQTSELCEVLDHHLKELRTVPPQPEAL